MWKVKRIEGLSFEVETQTNKLQTARSDNTDKNLNFPALILIDKKN